MTEGSGKSTLLYCPSSFLYSNGISSITEKYLQQHSNIAMPARFAIVHFEYDDPNATPLKVAASLLRQLLANYHDIPDPLLMALAAASEKTSHPYSLRTVREWTSICLSYMPAVFFLFDAFNECEQSHRKDLLKYLSSLNQKRIRVRTLFMTTPDLQVPTKLAPVTMFEIAAQENDVRQYLRARLETTNAENDPVEFKDAIIAKVSKKSERQ